MRLLLVLVVLLLVSRNSGYEIGPQLVSRDPNIDQFKGKGPSVSKPGLQPWLMMHPSEFKEMQIKEWKK